MFTGVEEFLVPGRECGACTSCCTHLNIDAPELQKPGGVTCLHCALGAGCKIYAARPQLCRSWYCGWRIMPQFAEDWRPDRSEVLITLETEDIPPDYETRVATKFDLIGALGVVLQPRFLEAVAFLVEQRHPVFVCVPKNDGRAAGKTFLNEMLEEPVRLRDYAAIRRLVVEAVAAAGRHEGEEIVFKNRS